MTEDQRTEKLTELHRKITQIVDDFEQFVEKEYCDESHELWQVWQPLSTAEGRLTAFLLRRMARP